MSESSENCKTDGLLAMKPSKSDSLLNPVSDSSDSLSSEPILLRIHCKIELFVKSHGASQLQQLVSHLHTHLHIFVQLSQHIWAGTGETDSVSFVNSSNSFFAPACLFVDIHFHFF